MKPRKPTKKAKPKKSTSAIVQSRVEEILKIRLAGAQFHDVRSYAREPEQNWRLSDGQLGRYIVASNELLAKTLEKDRPALYHLHLAQRRALYAQALQTADLRTALAVLRDEAELLGLYENEAVAGLEAAVAELKARLDARPTPETSGRRPGPTDGPGQRP